MSPNEPRGDGMHLRIMGLQALPSHMMPPGGRQPELPPMHGNLGPALFRSTPAGEGPVPDAHERNAMIGHTLSAVDALLVALRSGLSGLSQALLCLPVYCSQNSTAVCFGYYITGTALKVNC